MAHNVPRVRILDSGGIAGVLTDWVVRRVQIIEVASPSGLDLRISPQCPAISRFHCKTAGRKFPFVLLSNALVEKTADIQPNSAGWRHFTGLEPYFQGSHENSVVSSGKSSAPEYHADLNESKTTAYAYTVDLLRVFE